MPSPEDPYNDSHNQYVSPEFHEIDPEDAKTEQEKKEEQGLEDARSQNNRKKKILPARGVSLTISTIIFITLLGIGVWVVARQYSVSSKFEVSLKGGEEKKSITFLCPKVKQAKLRSLAPDITKETLRQEENQIETLRKELNQSKTQTEDEESRNKRQKSIEQNDTKQNSLTQEQELLEKEQERTNPIQELNQLKREVEEEESRSKRQILTEQNNTKQETLTKRQEELEKKRKRYNTQVQEYNRFIKEECERK